VAGVSPASGFRFAADTAASTGNDAKKRPAERATLTFANFIYAMERKTPPSGRPGQVKALDGVSPQPQIADV